MAETNVIKTGRPGLVLAEMKTVEDDEAFFRLQQQNREHIARFGNKIDATVEASTARRLGRIRFGIYQDGRLIGSLDFVPSDDGTEAEVGISLTEPAVGYGYATAAFTAGLSHMRPRYNRIFAQVRPDNVQSLKLCRRAGLIQRQGVAQREWGPALVFDVPK